MIYNQKQNKIRTKINDDANVEHHWKNIFAQRSYMES